MMNTSEMLLARRAKYSHISDEDLYEIFDQYASCADMLGYSAGAKLDYALAKAGVKAELMIRNLIPMDH